jgi:sulfite exporter TauE/SafE
MASWKTTLGGILSALGLAISQMEDPIYKAVGAIISGIGMLLLGIAARDNKVSSEKAGAK